MGEINIYCDLGLRKNAEYIQNILSSLFVSSKIICDFRTTEDISFKIFIISNNQFLKECSVNSLFFINDNGNSEKGCIFFQNDLKKEDFAYEYFFDFIAEYLKQYNLSINQIDYNKTLAVYSNAEFAESYFQKWHNDIPVCSLEKFNSLLPEKSLVLDAGCGPGHHSHYLSKKGHFIYGIDLSKTFIDIAKKQYSNPNIQFCVDNMLNMSFKNETFDGIWCCAALIHIPKTQITIAFKEFYRILKPNGIAVVTMCICQNAHKDKFDRAFESYYSQEEILKYLTDFNIVDVENTYTKNSTQGDLILVNWLRVTLKKHCK
jgi:ubiquinone/menaquinone biosynthesis C-methylase UbiE